VWRAKDPPDLTAQVNAVAFHPDGQRVAAGTQDGRVICWDTETDSVLWIVRGRR
jgi:WD40 repeat protein